MPLEPQSTIDPLELERYRPALLKFAMLQLRNAAVAEDVVQETLLAALQSAASYAGQSSIKTWLIGILKHKIIDTLRRRSREQLLADTQLAPDDVAQMFKEDGHFLAAPADWGDPETALSERKFFEALERCVEGLPKNTARVFMLREVLGLETDEICKDLGISASNCWVLLYRARMALRACLEQRWFGARARI